MEHFPDADGYVVMDTSLLGTLQISISTAFKPAPGILGIIDEVDARLAELDPIELSNMEAITFLKAMKISLASVIVWAEHLSDEAARQAAECADAQRKAELEKIAAICKKVPANPAETFYEALQSTWITYIAIMQESWGPGVGFGRMDQMLWPFYKKDIENGVTYLSVMENNLDTLREALTK